MREQSAKRKEVAGRKLGIKMNKNRERGIIQKSDKIIQLKVRKPKESGNKEKKMGKLYEKEAMQFQSQRAYEGEDRGG